MRRGGRAPRLQETAGGRKGVGMTSADWMIDFAFDYPVDCTPDKLLERLESLSTDWPGWDNFPWRVTRSIHKFLDHPPVNFHYLTIHRCLQGYAAHLVLNSNFRSRPEVLAAMIREKCEIVGLLRVLLIDAVRYELRFTKMDYIRDCSGPGDRHEQVPPEELEKRRAAFRECIEGAEKEFVRILDLMSVSANMNARIFGRMLRTWAHGGDMPEAVTLPVQVEMTAAGKLLKPCQSEMALYARGGFTMPEVLVERREKKAGGCRLKADFRDQISEVRGQREGEATDGADLRGSGESGRVRAKRVAAGRNRSVVTKTIDRKAIRSEVRRVVKLGLSQTEACRQVSDQAQKGRAGAHTLTRKYDLAPYEATPSVVRRVVLARW